MFQACLSRSSRLKKPNQGLKRPIQIEQEGIKGTETQEELEESTRQSDPLNFVFTYLDSRFQDIQNQIRKNKDKDQLIKKENSRLKLLNKKVTGCNTNLTQI